METHEFYVLQSQNDMYVGALYADRITLVPGLLDAKRFESKVEAIEHAQIAQKRLGSLTIKPRKTIINIR